MSISTSTSTSISTSTSTSTDQHRSSRGERGGEREELTSIRGPHTAIIATIAFWKTSRQDSQDLPPLFVESSQVFFTHPLQVTSDAASARFASLYVTSRR